VALGHLWSLAIEEQFYVVWPFVVAYFSRGSLIKLCVAIIAGTLALRVGILIYHNSTAAHWFVFFSTITRFDGLAFGALGAAIVRSPEARGAMARVSLPIILASGLGLLLIFSHKGRIAAFHDLMTLTVGFSLTASLAFGIIMHVTLAHSGIIRRILNLSILRQAGHYSYAMYLIHWPAILASNSILIKIGFGHAFNATAMLCLPLLITSIGAWLSWNLIEAPALALRKPLIARLPAH
jgi:peptidoglycan/LPS O-acetylase OafA/YrhL